LTTQTGPPAGLQDFLQNIGWYRSSLPNCSPENPDACYPAGAVLMTTNTWQQPIPLVAIGNSLCSCYSPLTTDGPHCDMPCSYFNGQDLYYPPPAPFRGPLLGSYTPNNQSFQDMSTYPNMFNTPSDSINMAVSVLEIGWSANDWPKVEQQLNAVWNIEMAVPMITWMPYAFKTWSSHTPNKDIYMGKYDDYIDQFLGNLSSWVQGKRVYLRFAPQPNGDWFPWSPVCGSCSGNGQSINQTVASYADMWNYVIAKVRSSKYNLGTDVLMTIFDVNNDNAPDSAAGKEFLPSSLSTIDWIGVTGYNWGTTLPGNTWSTPSEVFAAQVAAMQAAASGKPLALFSASTSTPNGVWGKNTWIETLFAYAADTQAKMLVYHNADSSTDLACFGGETGASTWNSPLSGISYNVYPMWSTAVNNATYGVQGTDSTNSQYISQALFAGQ